jgi:hypothetical protein
LASKLVQISRSASSISCPAELRDSLGNPRHFLSAILLEEPVEMAEMAGCHILDSDSAGGGCFIVPSSSTAEIMTGECVGRSKSGSREDYVFAGSSVMQRR